MELENGVCPLYIKKIDRDLAELLQYYYTEMKEKNYDLDATMKTIYCALVSLLMSHILSISAFLDTDNTTREDFILNVKKDLNHHIDNIKPINIDNLVTKLIESLKPNNDL